MEDWYARWQCLAEHLRTYFKRWELSWKAIFLLKQDGDCSARAPSLLNSPILVHFGTLRVCWKRSSFVRGPFFICTAIDWDSRLETGWLMEPVNIHLAEYWNQRQLLGVAVVVGDEPMRREPMDDTIGRRSGLLMMPLYGIPFEKDFFSNNVQIQTKQ